MKKTLIALLALAGVAGAYTVDEADIVTTASSANFDTAKDSGIVVSVLDIDAFMTALTTTDWNQNLLSLTFNNNVNFGLGQGCYGGVNEYRFYNGTGGATISGGGYALNGNGTGAQNWKASDIITALEGANVAVLTFATQKGSGSYAMLTIATQDAEGTVSYKDFGATFSDEYRTSQNTVKAFTVNDPLVIKAYGYSGKELSTAAIIDTTHNVAAYHAPEPATATLSLLALAGLAARRKRH